MSIFGKGSRGRVFGGIMDGGGGPSPVASATYFDEVQAQLGAANIVAHYKHDGTTGTTAADATSSGYDGTYTNGPTLGATSLLTSGGGTAVDFDGVNDYVDLGNAGRWDFIHQSGVFVIGFWCDFTRGAQQIAIANTQSNVVDGFFLRFRTSGQIEAGLNGASNFSGSVATSASAVSDGVHFCTLTGDGTDMRVYVDAVEVASTGIAPGGAAAGYPLLIAAEWQGGSPGFFFNGRIDEVTIANVTATPAQISALYAYGTT